MNPPREGLIRHLPPIVDLLQSVDPISGPSRIDRELWLRALFASSSGYRVEFLTSNRGSDDYIDQHGCLPWAAQVRIRCASPIS